MGFIIDSPGPLYRSCWSEKQLISHVPGLQLDPNRSMLRSVVSRRKDISPARAHGLI